MGFESVTCETGQGNLSSFLDWIEALGPMAIALMLAVIAYQQWKVNKSRLRHEMFDRRYAMYEATKKLTAAVIQKGTPEKEDIDSYFSATAGARFIFSDQVGQHLEEMFDRAIGLQRIERRLKYEKDMEKRTKLLDEEEEIFEWFLEHMKKMPDILRPYLAIE